MTTPNEDYPANCSYALSVYRMPESRFENESKLFEFTKNPRIDALYKKLQDYAIERVRREYKTTLQKFEDLL